MSMVLKTEQEWRDCGYGLKPGMGPIAHDAHDRGLYSITQVINLRDIFERPQRWEMGDENSD